MRLLSSTGLPLGCHRFVSLCSNTQFESRGVPVSHFTVFFFHTILANERRSGDTPRLRCSFFFSRFLKVKQILQIFIPTGSEDVFLWLTLSLLNWQMKKMGVRTWGLSAAPLSLMSFHPSFNTKAHEVPSVSLLLFFFFLTNCWKIELWLLF